MNKIEFAEEIEQVEISDSIIQAMKQSEFPFVIWGIGSLSHSIKKYMDICGIKISCYWVDGECMLEDRDGIPILSLLELESKFDKFNVVFGHSKYELKREIKKRCKNIQNVFCIPNVCYGQYQKMEKSFFENNIDQYYKNFCLLNDSTSETCMIAYLKCKLSENVDYIIDIHKESISYFENPVFTVGKNEVYVDIGAYTGDSLDLFLRATGNSYKKVYAYEPEKRSFSLLKKYVEKKKLRNVVLEQKGTWNKKDKLYFDDTEESSSVGASLLNDKTLMIEVDTLDDMLKGEEVTLVKINFWAGVKETIEGMKKLMVQRKPKLVMTVGFDEYALLSIPLLIKEINPAYKLYLRFADAMPARLLLFAV